jgi:hypothetical protein
VIRNPVDFNELLMRIRNGEIEYLETDEKFGPKEWRVAKYHLKDGEIERTVFAYDFGKCCILPDEGETLGAKLERFESMGVWSLKEVPVQNSERVGVRIVLKELFRCI